MTAYIALTQPSRGTMSEDRGDGHEREFREEGGPDDASH